MKDDEIKEILDNVRKCCDITKDQSFVVYQRQDILKLLDYITNLQQENEYLKKNQRYYKNGVFSLEYDKETMSDMIDDYKSRVEKAVEYLKNEYLKNNCYIGNCINTYEAIDITNVMDILNGGSDE